jgi:hypothetical protein
MIAAHGESHDRADLCCHVKNPETVAEKTVCGRG